MKRKRDFMRSLLIPDDWLPGSCFLTLVLTFAVLPCIGGATDSLIVPVMAPEPRVDSIEIIAENVFDLSDPRYDNFLFRLANFAHVVTRRSVIRRELLLLEGDPFDTALANESARNLRRLIYLLKTDIRLKQGDKGENIMVVNTSDRWTTVAGGSFHRSGGRSDLQITLEESNLLGYGITMSHDYFILEYDRSFYQGELSDDRFLGRPMAIGIFYSDNPRAGQVSLMASKPFYSLKQRWGGMIQLVTLRRRLDYFLQEALTAQDKYRRYNLQLQYSYRIGSEHIKYYFTPEYTYVDLQSRGRNVYDSAAIPILPPIVSDSLLHFPRLTFRLQQVRYIQLNRVNRFHKPEDISLGLDTRVTYGTGLRSNLAGSQYNYFAFWPQYVLAVKSSLLIAGIRGQEWWSTGGKIRRTIDSYLIGYSRYHPNLTLAAAVRFSSDRFPSRANTLYLDEDNGLRGYPAFAMAGEERLIINLENRFFSNLEILSVGIGGVVFADIGNIWSRDDALILRNTESALGLGLRLGVSRSTQGEVIRMDLAYAIDRKAWQISVGTGQFF